MTPFVGRAREEARLRAELEAGRNLILTGAYGIGRTALVRHVAQVMADRWRFVFVDFSRPGSEVCRDLFPALFPKWSARLRGEPLSYKWARYRVATRRPEDPRCHVLVLDDIARLSAPKLDLVRWLGREGRFRFVAIVESFIPAADLARLQGALFAGPPLRLGPLGLRDADEFFEECARARGLPWSRHEVHGLALAAHGFPLGMRELLSNELRRRGR